MIDREFTTDDGRFTGQVLLKIANPISPYATLGIKITDNQNIEQWSNYVQMSDSLLVTYNNIMDDVAELLKENVFCGMEMGWTRRLKEFLPDPMGIL